MAKVNKIRYLAFFFILAVILTGVSIGGQSMGLFDFLKIVMASEFNGVATLEGKPLAGAKVTRLIEDDKNVIQTTTTDANGRFKFEAVKKKSIHSLIPLEAVFGQFITIHHGGKEYNAFSIIKRNYYADGELRYATGEVGEVGETVTIPLNFSCELTDEDQRIKTKGGSYRGICQLTTIP